MKAVQINRYGGNEVFEVNKSTPEPINKEKQLLVAVYGTCINPFDLALRAGLLEKAAPLTFPINMGGDFSGKVIAVGGEVTEFKVGDEVFGQGLVLNGSSGAWAELAAVNSRNTALKPQNSSFKEAGALPLAGTSAVQALEEHIGLQEGQKILIHGGAGGIGHIAIQLAKSMGAYVATTVSYEDAEFAAKLGGDKIVNYQSEAFEKIISDYDAVFDTVGGEITDKSVMVLKKGGILVSMKGKPNEELIKEREIEAIGQTTRTNTQLLQRLAQLVDTGKIRVTIDREFEIEQIKLAAEAQAAHPRGKIALKVRD